MVIYNIHFFALRWSVSEANFRQDDTSQSVKRRRGPRNPFIQG